MGDPPMPDGPAPDIIDDLPPLGALSVLAYVRRVPWLYH